MAQPEATVLHSVEWLRSGHSLSLTLSKLFTINLQNLSVLPCIFYLFTIYFCQYGILTIDFIFGIALQHDITYCYLLIDLTLATGGYYSWILCHSNMLPSCVNVFRIYSPQHGLVIWVKSKNRQAIVPYSFTFPLRQVVDPHSETLSLIREKNHCCLRRHEVSEKKLSK